MINLAMLIVSTGVVVLFAFAVFIGIVSVCGLIAERVMRVIELINGNP